MDLYSIGWDHRDEEKVEDHEPPDRPTKGGNTSQGSSSCERASWTPASRKRKGNSQSRTAEDETVSWWVNY